MRLLHHKETTTLGAGVAIGLLLSMRPWLVFAAGVACGLLLVGGWRLGQQLLGAWQAWGRDSRRRRRLPGWLRDADPPPPAQPVGGRTGDEYCWCGAHLVGLPCYASETEKLARATSRSDIPF